MAAPHTPSQPELNPPPEPPPVSDAISFNPTAVIHGPPNDRPSRISDTLAITQEVRVSIVRVSAVRVSMGRCSIERDSMSCVVKPVPGGLALSQRPGRVPTA